MDEYLYTNGKFEPTKIRLENESDESDCEAVLRANGWRRVAELPNNEDEFGEPYFREPYIDAQIYAKDYGGYLVQIWLNGNGLMDVLCPTGLDLAMLHRDFLIPLCPSRGTETLMDVLFEARRILFDENNGLPCAQRVKAEDRRQDERNRRRRLEEKKVAS
jgi:hypothetical protein